MKPIKDLEALFLHYIQNLYSAEEQLIETMPAIIEKASHRSLKNALQHHFKLGEAQKKTARTNSGSFS
jgi:ferritin-like metal-binding protein YciE